MTTKQKTILVTAASQRIGAAVANQFLDCCYNVVGGKHEQHRESQTDPS